MANASATAENQSLDALGGSLPGTPVNMLGFVSLHVGSPGTTGANENASTGGYARQACTWNNASGGAKTNSSALTFSTLGTVAVTNFGTFSAASAGTYGIGGTLTSSVTAASITVAAGAISLSSS